MKALKREATMTTRSPCAASLPSTVFMPRPFRSLLSFPELLHVQQVSFVRQLAAQVRDVLLGGRHLDRYALDHAQTKTIQSDDLLRIIGHEPDLAQPQIGQHLGAQAKIPQR